MVSPASCSHRMSFLPLLDSISVLKCSLCSHLMLRGVSLASSDCSNLLSYKVGLLYIVGLDHKLADMLHVCNLREGIISLSVISALSDPVMAQVDSAGARARCVLPGAPDTIWPHFQGMLPGLSWLTGTAVTSVNDFSFLHHTFTLLHTISAFKLELICVFVLSWVSQTIFSSVT